MILYVRENAWMRLGHTTELRFPVAIEDDPIDMTPSSIGFPAELLRRIEVHVVCRADGIVRIQQSLHRPLTHECACDPDAEHLVPQDVVHALLQTRNLFFQPLG